MSDKLCVAHYASRYLPLTENWIYRVLINHKKYKPIFLSRKKENLSLFSIPSLFSLDDFGRIRQYLEILTFRFLGYFVFMRDVCAENNVKILHVHFGYHGVKMIGLRKRLNVPMICSFYGDDAFSYPLIGNMKEKYQNLFKEANRILVLGPYMKSQLISLGCDEQKLAIHHLGIDVDVIRFEKRLVTKKDKVKFLIASSFVEKKGIDLAIKALAGFKRDFNFSLDIIGDGPLKREIMNEIIQCGLEGHVNLHGYKPYDYLIDLSYRCDVFIQASRTSKDNRKEGTPMVIVDVMAGGMAVVSTKHSDIPEIVLDDLTGYLAEENDVESLRSCIQKVFDNPEKIGILGEKGRERTEKEFNAKTQTQKLEAYYSELISKQD